MTTCSAPVPITRCRASTSMPSPATATSNGAPGVSRYTVVLRFLILSFSALALDETRAGGSLLAAAAFFFFFFLATQSSVGAAASMPAPAERTAVGRLAVATRTSDSNQLNQASGDRKV